MTQSKRYRRTGGRVLGAALTLFLVGCAATPKLGKDVSANVTPFGVSGGVKSRILVPARYLGTQEDKTQAVSIFAMDAMKKELALSEMKIGTPAICTISGRVLRFDRRLKGNGRSDVSYRFMFTVKTRTVSRSITTGYTHHNAEKDRYDPEYAESLAEVIRQAVREQLLAGDTGSFIRNGCSDT